MTLNEKFMVEISKIKEAEVFLGVCRVLKVELLEEEEPKDFTQLFEEVMHSFDGAGRHKKKELLKLLANANKEESNGNNSKDTEKDLPN